MRIEDKSNISNFENVKDVQKKGEEKKQVKAVDANKMATKDTVDISSSALKTAGMVDQIKTMPDVREDKVNSIKKQVDQGTYSVEGKKVAEKVGNSAIDGTF